MSEYPLTPELDKLLRHSAETEAIGEFLDWMSDQGMEICRLDDASEQHFPVNLSIEKMLAQYFCTDLRKVEMERRAILLHLAESSKPATT